MNPWVFRFVGVSIAAVNSWSLATEGFSALAAIGALCGISLALESKAVLQHQFTRKFDESGRYRVWWSLLRWTTYGCAAALCLLILIGWWAGRTTS